MWPFGIEVISEFVEPPLLSAQRRGRRLSGFPFQRSMHPLVPAVLLWATWLNPFVYDAQPQPVKAQFAEAQQSRSRKGRTVISSNSMWHSELFHGRFADCHHVR